MSEVKYDPILGKLREGDTGGGSGGSGTVTGIEAVVDGGTATVTATGGVGAVKFVGVSGTTIGSNGSGEIEIAGGGGGSFAPASVSDVMTGTNSSKGVDVSALRGGLTAGQAVDVTSQPDGVTGDWKGTFDWTGGYLGFDNSFPKYAAGLTYLLIADLTYSSVLGDEHILVSPSGTWLDGSTTAIRINDGETKRVAMLFYTNTAKLTVSTPSVGDEIIVSNLREYEVTSCTPDAIAYIAALSNPDVFQDYYLVKRDQVSPWTYIINMGTSPATTVAAGLAYQINATEGSHIITTDVCPDGYVGRDTFVRLLVGQTGNVVVQAPLKLGTALTANAINNCEVKYRDGEAIMTVTDTLGGYIVTEVTGTTDGTLYYGLTTSASQYPYITFTLALDGQAIDLGGATVSTQKILVGNGQNATFISGSFKPNSQTQLENLALSGVTVLAGGRMALDKTTAVAPNTTLSMSGATVSLTGGTVSGAIVASGGSCILSSAVMGGGTISRGNGQLVFPNGAEVSGSGVINPNGSNLQISANVTASFNGCTFSGGSAAQGGCFNVANGGKLVLSGVTVTGCTATYGGVFRGSGTENVSAYGCTFSGNSCASGGVAYAVGSYYFEGCTFAGNSNTAALSANIAYAAGTAQITFSGCTLDGQIYNAGSLVKYTYAGSCALPGLVTARGATAQVLISAGATLNMTGNANVAVISGASGVIVGSNNNGTFVPTGSATVINSAGATVTITGSGTILKNNGTLS